MTYPTIKLKLTHKGKCINVEAPANATFGDLKVQRSMLLHLIELKRKCNESVGIFNTFVICCVSVLAIYRAS